jgi:hypothetical protein
VRYQQIRELVRSVSHMTPYLALIFTPQVWLANETILPADPSLPLILTARGLQQYRRPFAGPQCLSYSQLTGDIDEWRAPPQTFDAPSLETGVAEHRYL